MLDTRERTAAQLVRQPTCLSAQAALQRKRHSRRSLVVIMIRGTIQDTRLVGTFSIWEQLLQFYPDLGASLSRALTPCSCHSASVIQYESFFDMMSASTAPPMKTMFFCARRKSTCKMRNFKSCSTSRRIVGENCADIAHSCWMGVDPDLEFLQKRKEKTRMASSQK